MLKMFEQFGNYPEIQWLSTAAAQFYSGGDEIQISPDLGNFKLVRFKDLRKHPKINEKRHFKLMLIGSSKTNVFIAGPDSKIDEIIKKLPKYIDKSWLEIKNMSLERDSLNCDNFGASACNPQLLDVATLKPVIPGQVGPELNLNKEDEICGECEHFEPK